MAIHARFNKNKHQMQQTFNKYKSQQIQKSIKYKSQQVQSQQIWQSIIKSIQTCACGSDCDYDYDYDHDGVVLCNFHPNPTSPIH